MEFRSFLDTIERNVPPDLDIHLILDNYGTHKTQLIHDWLAKRPRFHLHFTPTSASWLYLVERWFALLTEKQLRRGVHRSTQEMESAIRTFIQHHNKDPKPFIWHKTADQILDSVARFCTRTLGTGHLGHESKVHNIKEPVILSNRLAYASYGQNDRPSKVHSKKGLSS